MLKAKRRSSEAEHILYAKVQPIIALLLWEIDFVTTRFLLFNNEQIMITIKKIYAQIAVLLLMMYARSCICSKSYLYIRFCFSRDQKPVFGPVIRS